MLLFHLTAEIENQLKVLVFAISTLISFQLKNEKIPNLFMGEGFKLRRVSFELSIILERNI